MNANGKNGRFSIYDGDFDWELLAREARQYRPDLDASIPNVPKDKQTPVEQGTYTIDTSKAEKELGFKRKLRPFVTGHCVPYLTGHRHLSREDDQGRSVAARDSGRSALLSDS